MSLACCQARTDSICGYGLGRCKSGTGLAVPGASESQRRTSPSSATAPIATAKATGSTELRRLRALLRVLCASHVGPDLGLVERRFEFAVVADFDDLAGYQVYRDNPEHREIIGRFIQPIAAQRRPPQ